MFVHQGINLVVLGVTETHLLIFKDHDGSPQKGTKKNVPQKWSNLENKRLFLARHCDLQCISSINYEKEVNEIQLTVYKYRSIKSFNEYEPMTKKYILEDGEFFLKVVLKNITKFQQIKISFIPGTSQDSPQVLEKLNESQELEATLNSLSERSSLSET